MRPALEDHLHRDREDDVQKRDLVLGMPALLGIFSAVALLCALCFGYGYSSGHLRIGEVRPAPAAKVRPAPRPLGGSLPSAPPEQVEQASEPVGEEVPSMPPPEKTPPSLSVAPHRAAGVPLRENVLPKPEAGVPEAGVPPAGRTSASEVPASSLGLNASQAAPQTAPGANLMVQIAAVSREQDAQTLADALKHDGFPAMVRTVPGDKLYHVQIGPFAGFTAAKDMRARLVNSGYNAFIRP